MSKLTTKIVIDRFSQKDRQLLEHREQNSRSFVKQLWELMYISAAQINYALPRTGVLDINGCPRAISQVSISNAIIRNKYLVGTLCSIAPSGKGGLYIPTEGWAKGTTTSDYTRSLHPTGFLPGELIGIVIGGDDAAVAPNNYKLGRRIGHGVSAAVNPATIIESNTTGDTSDRSIFGGTSLAGLIFVPKRAFRLTSMKFLMYRQGNPGTLTLHFAGVRPVSAGFGFQWTPETPVDIATGTTNGDTLPNAAPYEWREVVLSTPVDVSPGIVYAAYFSGGVNATNRGILRYQNSTPVQSRFVTSSTSDGTQWSHNLTEKPLYELWGTAPAELEYGGGDIHGLTVANPNASFSISRLFYNNSGVSQDIKECGIQSPGIYNTTVYDGLTNMSSDVRIFLIARDVITPAINLSNGEVLQITYTPQITV